MINGPAIGRTVASPVISVPQIVTDCPHHFGVSAGSAGGKVLALGVGVVELTDGLGMGVSKVADCDWLSTRVFAAVSVD